MDDWKKRWVELNGGNVANDIAQFEVWQEHWVALHPEDAPPDDAPDDIDEFVGEMLQNLDKYLNDPEVIELIQTHNRVVSIDRQRTLRAERLRREPSGNI
jgi:hypothetical protein